MTFVLAAVAVVLLLAGAAALAGAAGAMRATQQLIGRRVDIILSAPATETHRATIGRAVERLRSLLGVGVPSAWRSTIPIYTLVLSALCAGALTWWVVCIALRLPVWIWVPVTLLALLAPPQLLLRLEQGRLDAKFIDMLPGAIDMIVRMLRAGLPMSAAIKVVAAETDPPMNEVFAGIRRPDDIGVCFEQALIAAGKKIRSQDFRFFVVAASLQQSTGGNLASTLEVLSEIVRKRRAARLKARAVTAEERMSAYILAAMPFVVVGALLLFSPAYLAPLITDRRGNIIVAIAVGELLIGFFVMRQMMRSVTRA